MTVEMKVLLALMIVTAVVSFAFALKMAWENLREGFEEESARPQTGNFRFGNGPSFTGSR